MAGGERVILQVFLVSCLNIKKPEDIVKKLSILMLCLLTGCASFSAPTSAQQRDIEMKGSERWVNRPSPPSMPGWYGMSGTLWNEEKLTQFVQNGGELNSKIFPKHCDDPLMFREETVNIPLLVNLSHDSKAKVTAVLTLVNSPSQFYFTHYPLTKHKFINCTIAVKWSNGSYKLGKWFSIWENAEGEQMVSFGGAPFMAGY